MAPLSSEGGGGGPRGQSGDIFSKELLPGQGTLGDFGGPQDVRIPERFLKAGRGPGEGTRPGVGLIDTSDPDFTEYFETIKKRVYTAWKYPKGVRGEHKVSLRFHLDQAGGVRNVKVVDSTNQTLNESAVQAMERASPFPPIPEKFKKLVGEPLVLIFTVIIQ
ncbi:MAG: TonB C-terminal domain-containing protein [candidate division NC10 bacterium]|nr:TonB C-terminal domain-containing protein [candidate division NC10 bacterium]